MKTVSKVVEIIAFFVIIGFLFVACGDVKEAKDELDGTNWFRTFDIKYRYVLTFDSPNFTITVPPGGGYLTLNGTYTISDNNVMLSAEKTYTIGVLSGKPIATGILSDNTLSFGSDKTAFVSGTFTKVEK